MINTRDPELLGASLHFTNYPANGYDGVLTWKNGTKYKFESTGGLQQAWDTHGNWIFYWIYRYSNGKASKILLSPSTSQQNRYLLFSYSWPDYLLQSATLHYDAGGTGSVNRTWNFSYDASSRLSTVTAPDNGVTTFAWTTYARSDGQVLPLITTVTNPRNKVAVSNQYDSAGRVTQQTFPDEIGRAHV